MLMGLLYLTTKQLSMLYLLWCLLNIGFFIFFIVVCFRATKLVRENLGLFSSIVFVFGLLSFVGKSNSDRDNREPNSNQIKTWKFTSTDSLDKTGISSTTVKLDQSMVLTYGLHIEYGKDKEQMNKPISANSSVTGLVCGTNWKPLVIVVNPTDDNTKFEYFVDGTVEWKLLGAIIYSQPNEYKGYVSVK
jgi:hypothetical protein